MMSRNICLILVIVAFVALNVDTKRSRNRMEVNVCEYGWKSDLIDDKCVALNGDDKKDLCLDCYNENKSK